MSRQTDKALKRIQDERLKPALEMYRFVKDIEKKDISSLQKELDKIKKSLHSLKKRGYFGKDEQRAQRGVRAVLSTLINALDIYDDYKALAAVLFALFMQSIPNRQWASKRKWADHMLMSALCGYVESAKDSKGKVPDIFWAELARLLDDKGIEITGDLRKNIKRVDDMDVSALELMFHLHALKKLHPWERRQTVESYLVEELLKEKFILE